jgi:hypothetical protein
MLIVILTKFSIAFFTTGFSTRRMLDRYLYRGFERNGGCVLGYNIFVVLEYRTNIKVLKFKNFPYKQVLDGDSP